MLSSSLKHIGQTIPTGTNMSILPMILICHPGYTSVRKLKGIRLILGGNIRFFTNTSGAIPYISCSKGKYTNLQINIMQIYTDRSWTSLFILTFLILNPIINLNKIHAIVIQIIIT
jgi:hypothetical protein